MFNNKIINIITRILGAIFLLLFGTLIITFTICAITNYDVQTIIINVFSFTIAILITIFIYLCIGEFLEWIFDKLDK